MDVMDKHMEEQKVATLLVVIHDDGKHYHIRPLPASDGADYQCNMYERIALLTELPQQVEV